MTNQRLGMRLTQLTAFAAMHALAQAGPMLESWTCRATTSGAPTARDLKSMEHERAADQERTVAAAAMVYRQAWLAPSSYVRVQPAPPDPALTRIFSTGAPRTVSAVIDGVSVTGVFPRAMSDADALALLRRDAAEDKRLGPEKNPLLLAVRSGDPARVRAAGRTGTSASDVVDRRGARVDIIPLALEAWLRDSRDSRTPKPTVQQDADAPAFLAIVRELMQAGAKPSGLDWILSGTSRQAADPRLLPEFAALLISHGAELNPDSSLAELAQRNPALADAVLGLGKVPQRVLDRSLGDALGLGRRDLVFKFLDSGADASKVPQMLTSVIWHRDRELWLRVKDRLDVNARLANGGTALVAVTHDHWWMRELLARGANPESTNAGGNLGELAPTALHAAMAVDPELGQHFGAGVAKPATRAATVDLLLRSGARPGRRDGQGRTPIMLARADDVQAISLLLAAGDEVVPPKSQDPGAAAPGPVTWALSQGNEPLAIGLLRTRKAQHPGDCAELHYAARSGAAATLRLMFDHGDSPSALFQPDGETLLVGAVSGGHLAAARAVLARFPAQVADRVSLPTGHPFLPRITGVTPLMVAARAGDAEMVDLLLRHRANPSAMDSSGSTALRWAETARGDTSKVVALLQKAQRR